MGKKKKGLRNYDSMGYLFVLPFVIVFCIFSIYPVLRTLYFSFTNAKIAGVGQTSWIWFDNYKRVITDKYFWRGPDNTDRIAASTEESMPDYLQYKDCTDNQ